MHLLNWFVNVITINTIIQKKKISIRKPTAFYNWKFIYIFWQQISSYKVPRHVRMNIELMTVKFLFPELKCKEFTLLKQSILKEF